MRQFTAVSALSGYVHVGNAPLRLMAMSRTRSSLYRWVTVVAFGCILAGAVTIAWGVARDRNEQARYLSAQEQLREAFGVFDTPPAADALDATVPLDAVPDPADVARRDDAVALLRIPGIDLEVATLNYREYDDLAVGVGYMPLTAPFGDFGTTIVVGHRTGFGAPFRRLDELSAGQSIFVTLRDGREIEYLVNDVRIEAPSTAIAELSASRAPSQLFLVTCHPEYSTEYRLIVVADAVAVPMSS